MTKKKKLPAKKEPDNAPKAKKHKGGNPAYDPEPNCEMVRTLATKGLSRVSIADQVGIGETTLYKYHNEDLRLGDGDHESLHLGNVNALSQLKTNPNVALRASIWALERRHGYGATVNVNINNQTPEEREEELKALKEEADRKLEPYLRLDRTVDFDFWMEQLDRAEAEGLFKGDKEAFVKRLATIKTQPDTIEGKAESVE
ncbi:helix-turn-helix resolvase-like protein [Shimia isoporae]|uniref:Helix-turn-helix resolvase-like protein n=1 Tax=Shimia isoporae TaxID=647720 RepID=A0A4R1NNY6_9RHOB|nr:helix-turn-helix domain-containing protein [Shimia isoporae]TCL09551.1 helix-turn-helix resolvase-like protein [Shimia isoporae]